MVTKKKKKKATKKKASKKPASRNLTELKLETRKGAQVAGGPTHVYSVALKSKSSSVTAGVVVAKTEAEARTKAKRLIRSLC